MINLCCYRSSYPVPCLRSASGFRVHESAPSLLFVRRTYYESSLMEEESKEDGWLG